MYGGGGVDGLPNRGVLISQHTGANCFPSLFGICISWWVITHLCCGLNICKLIQNVVGNVEYPLPKR